MPSRARLRSQAETALLRPALCGYTLLTTNTRRDSLRSRGQRFSPHRRRRTSRRCRSASCRDRAQRQRRRFARCDRLSLAHRPRTLAQRRDRRAIRKQSDAGLQAVCRHALRAYRRARSARIESEVECGFSRVVRRTRRHARLIPAPTDARRLRFRIVRGACPHDCPDTCAMLVTVENGRAIEIRGAADHPPTAGALCTKVAHYLERTYSDQRVLHPMRRVGQQGRRPLRAHQLGRGARHDRRELRRDRRIGRRPAGDRALLLCGHDGAPAIRLDGPALLPPARRVAARPDDLRDRGQGRLGRRRSARRSGTDVEQFEHSRLILIWGSNPIVSNLHFWTRAQEAKRRGAKLVAIDPYRSATADKCHEHVALLPGTDAALALGMMHVLIAEDLVDHDYVARYTVGFDALKAARRNFRRSASRRSADSRPSRSSPSRATTARRSRRRSASTTACSATPAAATRCARSHACRR